MARQRSVRTRDDLDSDSMLRLEDACEIYFNGALKPQALRREATKGNLVIVRIAGKDFVTPAAIAEMVEKCKVGGKG